jgi:uncharacterized protein YbjT (DUF2867 family)
MDAHTVFVTGGTGYIGRPLVRALLARAHAVRALARPGSQQKLPSGATPVLGDALDASTFAHAVAAADTFVHLIGTPHPSPAKAAQFRAVDRPSIDAALRAATSGRTSHFIYVSVAHPAPVMQAYIDVRIEGESLVRESGIAATIVRPWYVLGPGHRWPLVLQPLYALAERLPGTRASALRLGLVTLAQMVGCLVHAVEHPPHAVAVLDVPAIRARASDVGYRELA